jgi:hypothetical protein
MKGSSFLFKRLRLPLQEKARLLLQMQAVQTARPAGKMLALQADDLGIAAPFELV